VPNVSFVVGAAQALPYSEGSFTAVFAHTLLEHVPDPLAVAREMRRVLAPGGVIGVRDGDVGGRLLYPPDPAVQHNGGNPRQGRLQRALLHSAGFGDLRTSAGTNTFPPAQAADVFAEMLTSPRLADQALALGWVDRPTLDGYAVA